MARQLATLACYGAALACGAGGNERGAPPLDGDSSTLGTPTSTSDSNALGALVPASDAEQTVRNSPRESTTARDPFAAPACAPPAGFARPNSIGQVVDWINALPKPLTLACFLDTLERPLQVYASQSMFSAQPAAGWRSPRMFLFTEGLVMSIAPAGIGQDLLEFGERRPSNRSLKGELPFPVVAELAPSAPYDHVIVGGITTCSGCHGDEDLDPTIPFASAFISTAFRPLPFERVALDPLRLEARECDARVEPARCAMLVAVFGQGKVIDAEFPAELDTFY